MMAMEKNHYDDLENGTTTHGRDAWPQAEKDCNEAGIDITTWAPACARFRYLVQCMRDTTLEHGPTAVHKKEEPKCEIDSTVLSRDNGYESKETRNYPNNAINYYYGEDKVRKDCILNNDTTSFNYANPDPKKALFRSPALEHIIKNSVSNDKERVR